jgi:hypothetical protein
LLAPDELLTTQKPHDQRERADDARPDARFLRRLIAAEGGFTVDETTRVLLRSGIAVCADPTLAVSFDWRRWDDGEVTAWLTTVQDRLAGGDVHLGGWLDPNRRWVWLEPVWVLPEHLRPAAVALAKLHGQRAVFDLRHRRLIPIGATSDSSATR